MRQNLFNTLGLLINKMKNTFGNTLVLAPAKCVVVPSGVRRWQR
ncbi:MAG TPA: hypothetical protein VLG47_04570 [Candidatus Saccharimonadales bacterium]|nr:hypothetical protein [Candidatus Saccharimonadales bacterium]